MYAEVNRIARERYRKESGKTTNTTEKTPSEKMDLLPGQSV